MGWLITSERSRRYMGSNRIARSGALTAVPAVAIMHVVLAREAFKASQTKIGALEALEYLGPDYYSDDEITQTLFLGNLAIHLVLFGALFLLVWASKERTPTAN